MWFKIVIKPFVLWVYDVIPLYHCGGLLQLVKYLILQVVVMTVDVTTGRATERLQTRTNCKIHHIFSDVKQSLFNPLHFFFCFFKHCVCDSSETPCIMFLTLC